MRLWQNTYGCTELAGLDGVPKIAYHLSLLINNFGIYFRSVAANQAQDCGAPTVDHRANRTFTWLCQSAWSASLFRV